MHRRRKILKVGGAEDVIARENYMTTPTLCQTTPILARLRLPHNVIKSFSMKKRTVSQME
jgi:hypothetical protein